MDVAVTTLVVIMLLLQTNISKENMKKRSLLLACVCFITSLVLTFRFSGQVEVYGKLINLMDTELLILKSLGMLLFLNIPTVTLLIYYFNKDDKKGFKKENKNYN